MRLLMPELSARRLAGDITRIAPGTEIAGMADDGRIALGGRAIEAGELGPDGVWFNVDAARAGLTQRLFPIALQAGVRWVQTSATGLDDPRYRELLRNGVRLANSDAQAIAIAQYILAEVLSEWSRLPDLRAQQAQRQWLRTPFREVCESTWLIIGYGHIGQETARRARAFGARTIGLRRTPAPDGVADVVAATDELFTWLPQADAVVIAAPLTPQTRGLANAAFFKAMKPGAALVNIARGGIVDEDDLLVALDAGTPGVAILDVFWNEPLPADNPLWTHPRLRLSPHNSNQGEHTPARGDRLFLENLRRLLAGAPLVNEVRMIEPSLRNR
jgi:phosphoglycerate dehydrogenase-like enzyme